MSITTTSTKDSYVGNGTTSTPYPITFKYLENSHITVYVDDVAISDSYYTLTGDGSAGTGQFTTSLEYTPSQSVVVVLDVPFDQPTALQETGALPAKTLEESFDRLNMQIRRVWRKVQDKLTLSTDEGGTGSQGTADSLLGFDDTGNLSEVPNDTFLKTANNLSDVTASTARTNLDVDIAGTDNSTDVTLGGTGTYLSINGSQVITVDPIEGTEIASTGETQGNSFLRENGDGTCSWIDLSDLGAGNALVENPLSQFASTTSAQLASTISDETGTGALVFADNPTIDLSNATLDGGTVGVIQGDVGTLDIRPLDEGNVASTTARGESSVDLQLDRDNGDEVASGTRSGIFAGRRNKATASQSVAIGGTSNTSSGNDGVVSGNQNTNVSPRGVCMGGIINNITGTGSNHVLMGGTNNEVSASTSHSGIFAGNNNTVSNGSSAVLAGVRNVLSGIRAVALGATDGVASAADTLIAGGEATASHDGARVFGDTSTDPIASIANNEFAIQGSALRLVDGNEGAGKVLTADANGSGNWDALPSADTTTEGVVELATQAEVDAGTDTSRAVTPETLAAYSGLPDAFSPTTYAGEESVTFPNGLIMKHGFLSTANANGTYTVAFDTAFPTGVVSVSAVARCSATDDIRWHTFTSSTASFNIYSTGANDLSGFEWQAWGY